MVKRTMEFEEMIKLYQDGLSTTEIANLANVSPRYVRLILSDQNIEKRAFSSWVRKHHFNENYFKAWSNNMAYILGFFVADGVVAKDAQSISFAQKDKEHFEQIKKEFQTEKPLTQNKKTGVYLLTLNSKILRNDIIELHGIKPKKSLDIKIPYVPKEFMSHFIRGYFDGDGCIYEDKYFVNIVGGSLDFMKSLLQVFNEHEFKPVLKTFDRHYRVYISGYQNIKNFATWIYQDKEIYLQRKYDRYEKHVF
jgi:DNA-binding transcriptional regulator WhiA